MTMFKKAGSAIGRLSTATAPSGGGGLTPRTIRSGIAAGTYLAGYGGWLVAYRNYNGINHALICDAFVPAGATSFAAGAAASRDDAFLSISGYSIDDGLGNTRWMAAQASPNNFPKAGQIALLATGGFRDWYMPAFNEAISIQGVTAALVANGYVLPGVNILIAHQASTNNARDFNLSTGSSASISKTAAIPTIPVRRVPVGVAP